MRSCEGCGRTIEPFRPRKRRENKLVCEGCANGRPGFYEPRKASTSMAPPPPPPKARKWASFPSKFTDEENADGYEMMWTSARKKEARISEGVSQSECSWCGKALVEDEAVWHIEYPEDKMHSDCAHEYNKAIEQGDLTDFLATSTGQLLKRSSYVNYLGISFARDRNKALQIARESNG